MNKQTFTIEFGTMAPKLSDQIQSAGLVVMRTNKNNFLINNIQKDTDAITRLAIRGVLSESEVINARKRLVKLIAKHVRQKDPLAAEQPAKTKF